MNFGKRTSADEAERIVLRAIERGCTFFDTANMYEGGESERILGRALGHRRHACLIASKVGLDRRDGRPEGLKRESVVQACDESLDRLGTDCIDVYYLHAPDWKTPIESTLEGIQELLEANKIRHFGISNFASWQIMEVKRACDHLGIAHPVMAQQIYNMLIRQLDIEYFKYTRKYPIHTTVYNALAGGLLARDHQKEQVTAGSRFDKNAIYQRRYWTEAMFSYVAELRKIADSQGQSLAAFAYSWLAHRPGVDSILLGPATVEQLDFALDAVERTPSPEALEQVEALHLAFTGTDVTYAR
ncbi:aldo/keto reductase [Pendulispora brunnea]|uniref:Aldo/keto reductase n=1 Tax=Pendulispora brunnea TaxID=2905690 RepID=A0ABZ2KN07_9BACT